MAKGVGFGPEGDYKTAALGAVLFKMSEGRKGSTGFMEDYTYDLTSGEELELAAHMLEVSPVFAGKSSLKFRCIRLVSAGNLTRRALYSTALTARVSRFP